MITGLRKVGVDPDRALPGSGPPRAWSWWWVVSCGVADTVVAWLAGRDEVGGVVACCFSGHLVVYLGGRGGAAVELESASVCVAGEDVGAYPSPCPGAACLPALAHARTPGGGEPVVLPSRLGGCGVVAVGLPPVLGASVAGVQAVSSESTTVTHSRCRVALVTMGQSARMGQCPIRVTPRISDR